MIHKVVMVTWGETMSCVSNTLVDDLGAELRPRSSGNSRYATILRPRAGGRRRADSGRYVRRGIKPCSRT
jgi:hypothetical protein